MRRALGWFAAIAVSLGGAGLAHAQQVQGEAQVTVQPGQVQGQVYVQPQQQPYVYPQQQPPPGYGQPYQQPYQQPQPYYVQPQPVAPAQPRYVERSESIPGLLVSGVIILPVSWVLTWSVTTATLDSSRDIDYWAWSWVPIIGPWFMLGQGDDATWGRGLNESEVGGAIFAGIAQATGLLLIILGAAIRRTVRVQTYALGDDEHAPQLSFSAAPVEGGGVLGATLTHF